MNVVVKIQGRAALPVRALPAVSKRRLLTPVLAAHLLGETHESTICRHGPLTAYHRVDGQILPVSKDTWVQDVLADMLAISDEVRSKFSSRRELLQRDGPDNEERVSWRRRSLEALPAGAFVWQDEYEMVHYRAWRGQAQGLINAVRHLAGAPESDAADPDDITLLNEASAMARAAGGERMNAYAVGLEILSRWRMPDYQPIQKPAVEELILDGFESRTVTRAIPRASIEGKECPMSAVIQIQGRQAIPVRAVPWLTHRVVLDEKEVAEALAWGRGHRKSTGLIAYRRDGLSVHPIRETFWENEVVPKLRGLWARLKAQCESTDEAVTAEATHEIRTRAPYLLPADAFVWRDDFEKYYGMHFGEEGISLLDEEHRLVPQALAAHRLALEFNPYIPPPDSAVVFEAFESERAMRHIASDFEGKWAILREQIDLREADLLDSEDPAEDRQARQAELARAKHRLELLRATQPTDLQHVAEVKYSVAAMAKQTNHAPTRPEDPTGQKRRVFAAVNAEIDGRMPYTAEEHPGFGAASPGVADTKTVCTPSSDMPRPLAGSAIHPTTGTTEQPRPPYAWTDEFKAEVRAYRRMHGLKKTAEHFRVSQSMISKRVPAEPSRAAKATDWASQLKR